MPPTTLNMDITVLPPDVLSLYDKSFYELVCLQLDDNRYIIKPGCKSNLRYFTQLLNVKNQEYLKTIALRIKPKQTSNDDDNNSNNNTLAS
ncbi:unnamed protein product [Rotaria socialis]|uniref:Uncharacterized protein n=1 Tax=Rotaria socialis TaxID=392032 RepID=A0A818CDH8_9BILA|nr:unnamed protein product [Rotaria socialis]CAF4338166.1 unnamed protein product [Rotaria socialis]CAF4445670.1 unnamed protein product [Rotaria socialis]CAF4681904.1 unnamed protein product [Rotaria socialis]